MRTRRIGFLEWAIPLAVRWWRGLAAAALMVAAVGVAVMPGSPAQAVPGVFADSASSPNDTVPLKTVSKDCTSGRVYGAGASIQGGFGDVVITAIIPNAQLTRVTVTAIQRVAVTTAWQVIARVICGPESGGLTRAVASATGSPPASVTATCPTGTNLFGTGMAIDNSVSNGTSAATLTRIVPTSATQVVVAAAETRVFAPSWTLTGYGICANPVATRVITSGISASSSDTLQQATSSGCGTGTRVHGLGMEVLPGAGVAAGDLILNSINTVGGSTLSGSTTIYERGTAISGNHQVRAFGICAS